MDDFSQKVFALLEDRKMTKADFSKQLNISPQNMNNYMKRGIPKKFIKPIANIFKIDTSYLLGEDVSMRPVSKVPVVGTASCGGAEENFLQEMNRICYYIGEFFHDKLYCVIANGDSMAPDIENGDEVICDPNIPPEHGDMVHYTLHGESAIKVLVKDEEAHLVSLKPYNPSKDFKTRTVRLDDDEANELKMVKVVAVNKLHFNNRAARLRLVGE